MKRLHFQSTVYTQYTACEETQTARTNLNHASQKGSRRQDDRISSHFGAVFQYHPNYFLACETKTNKIKYKNIKKEDTKRRRNIVRITIPPAFRVDTVARKRHGLLGDAV